MNNQTRTELQTGSLETLQHHLHDRSLNNEELACILINLVFRFQQPQWHALKDGPPDNKSIVMTYGYGCASSDYCQAYYSDGNWQEQDSCGDFFTYDPTHWAPMMDAPVYKEDI